MRSLLSASVLEIATLGLAAALPYQADARPPAWYGFGGGFYSLRGGGWGGRVWYAPGVSYYPHAFHYRPYTYYYRPSTYYAPYYYPSADYLVSVYYSAPELPHPTGGTAVAPADAGLIRLRVPDKFAEVTFNGQAVSSVGTAREYLTPALQVGQMYQYTITAAWGRGDQQTTRHQTIDITRGQIRTVDFSDVRSDR
jgi:uncharacterized protein (TIGR03000 family)